MTQKTIDQLVAHGVYPDAIEIKYHPEEARPEEVKQIDEQVSIDQFGAMHIKLPSGLVFGCFTVSLGDTFYDKSKTPQEQFNNNGHIGRLGWAKLWARLHNANCATPPGLPSPGTNLNGNEPAQPYSYFMININVPPQGAMSGGPTKVGYVTVEGDEIVVESRLHASWVMGFQIQFLIPGSTMPCIVC